MLLEDVVVKIARLRVANTLSSRIQSIKQSRSAVILAVVEEEESYKDKANSREVEYLISRADFITKTHVVLYFLKDKVVSASSHKDYSSYSY
jgi:hypothetical protein